MSKQLSYLRILANDYNKLFRFYNDVLNLELKFGEENGSYSEFATGNTDIAIFSKEEMAEQTDIEFEELPSLRSNVVVIFPVEDLDAEYKRLKSLGVKVLSEPTLREDWDVRTFHITDPEGNLIEINSRID